MEPLSSAAVAIASLVFSKAFEKTGENLGQIFTDRLSQFICLVRGKSLPKTQAIAAKSDELVKANYYEAVIELEAALPLDCEIDTAVRELTQVVESDLYLFEKVCNAAALMQNEPNIIQNQTKLAEKIGLVVQGGEVNIQNFSF